MQGYRAGLDSMQRALELDPELPGAASLHPFMGRAWAELANAEAEAEQYERTLRIEPRDSEALDLLAMAHLGQRRYEDALACIGRRWRSIPIAR